MTTIAKAEKELAELRNALKPINAKIKENGGSKSQLWLFRTEHKIRNVEEKIQDIKAGKKRTDEITPEGMEIEKRIISLEDSLEKTIKKEK